MATWDSSHASGDDALEEVRAATRALNEALGDFTRSAAEASARTSQAAVAGSMRKAADSLVVAAQRMGGTSSGHDGSRGRSEETRRRLLEAAGSVFAAKGYERASVADIAAAAGFTKGAFYASFPSKEAVFLEVARCRSGQAREGGLSDGDWVIDLDEIPIEDVLLQLEICLYAVRHEDSREVLAEGWRHSLETAAARVARSRGEEIATTEDTETAFALIAITLLGAITSAATSPDQVSPLVRAACARLLGANPGSGARTPPEPGGPRSASGPCDGPKSRGRMGP